MYVNMAPNMIDLAPKLTRAQEDGALSQVGRLCVAGAKAANAYSKIV